MSKLKVVALVLILCCLLNNGSVMGVMAANIEQEADSKETKEAVVVGKISDDLEEKLVGMSDEQRVLVDIQLVDSVDTAILEDEAYKKVKIDKEKLAHLLLRLLCYLRQIYIDYLKMWRLRKYTIMMCHL